MNRAGTQRVTRLVIFYVAALVTTFGGFVAYDRSTPGGTAAPEGNGILLFSLLFVAFAVAGILFALEPAPRRVEVSTDAVVVVGRYGRRQEWPALGDLNVHSVRRYPSGVLASAPVEMVEVSAPGRVRRTYVVEDGLFAGARAA